MQIHGFGNARRREDLSGQCVEVGFIAGRCLQLPRFNFGKAAFIKPSVHGPLDAATGFEKGSPVSVARGVPPWGAHNKLARECLDPERLHVTIAVD